MKLFWNSFFSLGVTALLAFGPYAHASNPVAIRPLDFDDVMRLVREHVDLRQSAKVSPHVDINDQAITFISKDKHFIVNTSFLLHAPTIDKRIYISQGPGRDDKARVRFILVDDQGPFEQFLYNGLGVPMQIYNREQEMFIYLQVLSSPGNVETKEWIYARRPNCAQGSRYFWKVSSEEFNRRLVLGLGDNNIVNIQRQVVVPGVDPNDYTKQRRIIRAVNTALKGKVKISGEDTIGQIEPVSYVTREGIHHYARFRLSQDHHELEIQINEPAQSYPIFIESN